MQYGLPYMGSKARIAKQLIDFLPTAEHFYDLFAGGCAVTHAALLSGKYKYVHCNDINDVVWLFEKAYKGGLRDERRWISREDFFALKDSDAYVRYCWSFGNKGNTYMYSREIEPFKKALHYAIMFNDFSLIILDDFREELERQLSGIDSWQKRRLKARKTIVDFFQNKYGCERRYSHVYGRIGDMNKFVQLYKIQNFESLERMTNLESLQSLESLERLERLQNLESLQSMKNLERLERVQSLESLENLQRLQSQERLERLQRLEELKCLSNLEITQRDYREVEILPDSVIYCDPPYRSTEKYIDDIDHEEFYRWCEGRRNVFISEYAMP